MDIIKKIWSLILEFNPYMLVFLVVIFVVIVYILNHIFLPKQKADSENSDYEDDWKRQYEQQQDEHNKDPRG